MADTFAADDNAAYAARVRNGVGQLGGAFFISRHARKAGKDLGLRGWPTYFVGRAGVLGPVDADVVASIVGFFPVEFVRKAWDEGREADLTLAVEVYQRADRDWGRAHLGGFDGAARLAELAEQVVQASSPVGAPLFAGWRALPLPDDAPGRLAQLMTTLRELRGGLHLSAVLAAQLSPREAILSGLGGVANASFFGWTDLEIDPSRVEIVKAARAEAERRTDRLTGETWLALGLGERAEFATLLDRAVTYAFPAEAVAPKHGRGTGSSLQESRA